MRSQKIFQAFYSVLSLWMFTACLQPDSSIDSTFFAGVKLSSQESILSVSETTVVSGSSITVTLTTKDEHGQIFKSPSPLNISLSAEGGSGYGQFSAVTDQGEGLYMATFRGINAGTAIRFKARINNVYTVSSSQEVTIIGGAVSLSQSSITVSSGSVSAGNSVTVTLVARDENNNPMTHGGLPITFSMGSGTSSGTSSGTFDPIVDHDNGTYTTVFHATTVGTAAEITASILGQSLTSTAPQVTVSPGSPATISMASGNSQSATVATSLISDFVVLIKDNFNNVVPGVTVQWAVSGGGTLTSATSTSNASGLASNHLTLGTSAGTKTITAVVAGSSLSTTFTATAQAGTPTSIAVSTGNHQTGSVGLTLSTPFSAVVYDTHSNVVPDVIIEWAVAAGGGGLSLASSTTGSSGTAGSTLTLGTTAGTNTVTATIYGSAISTSFSATGLALTTISSLAWQSAPLSSYTASHSSSMTSFSAKLLDTYGNIILSNNTTTATLSLTSGTSSLSGTITRTASSGIITFNDIKYTKAEAIVLKVTENGGGQSTTSNITVAPNVADSTQSSITSSASALANDNVATMTLTFTLKDAYGNPLPNAAVVFASSGTGNTLTQPSGVTNSSGQATGTLKSSVAEAKTISVTTPAISTTLDVTFAVPTLSIDAATAVKGGTLSFTVTQSVVAGNDVSFNYATSNGTAVAGTNYTTASGSKTISAGQTSTSFTVNTTDTNTDDPTLTFTTTLSGASGSGAVIGTAAATGTITDTSWLYHLTDCSLPADLNLSRSSSTGSYFDSSGVMQVAGSANLPRFDYDPVNHTCLGLLVEPASYNYILFSSDFSNGAWTDHNITKNANLTSPLGLDNNQTAVQVIENNSTAKHGITQTLTNPGSVTDLNVSVYVKRPDINPRNYLEMVIGDSSLNNACYSVFNLSTGANTSNTSSGTATVGTGVISAVANGWYRVSLYCNLNSAANAQVSFNLMNAASGSDQYAGTGSHSLYLWGPQAEWGNSFPTSYIVNNTNTAKYRAIETLTVNNFSTWFNYSNMTVSVDFSRAAIDDALALQSTYLWRIDDNSIANILMTKISGSGRKVVFYGGKNSTNSASQAQVNYSLSTPHTIYQYVGSYADSGAAVYQNINATLSPLGTLSSLYLPAAADLNRFAYIANTPTYYRRLAYRGRALSSTKLSSLTGTFVASATHSTISSSGPTTANGTSDATVTITLKNASNVGMPGFVPAFTASGSGNTVGVCTMTDANGVSTCSLSSTATGTKTIKISVPAGLTGVTSTAVFN